MLFFLTGDIQTGKTRWLETALEALAEQGVGTCGVLAPGVWREHADGTFEKLGIDNVLLPSGERIPFARRNDLAIAEGSYDSGSQAAQAKLSWAIDDAAIERVNAHLEAVAADTAGTDSTIGVQPRLLVIDELGRLELERGQGLTAALDLIDRGATPALPHALVIVRSALIDAAYRRFAAANWGGTESVSPGNSALKALSTAF